MKWLPRLGLGLLAISFLSLGIISESQALVCAPGSQAQVLWKGNWYPATVRKAKSNRCYIHYDGYNNSWDEWVGPERIRFPDNVPAAVVAPGAFQIGSPVSVLWHGKWYPAHVLSTKGNKLYIHYDGYGSSWDEWVGPSRYRAR